jgi:CrcB protein
MNLATLGWSGLISCAGACGALARYLIGRLIATRINTTFPWATLLINVSGAFLIGLISGLVTRHVVSAQAQSVLATGLLGGYTTFSTMSWESVQLARGGNRRQAILYLGGNFVPGLIAAAVGLLIGGLV